MPSVQLQMSSTSAQLGYEITRINQSIEQPAAELSIEQPEAVMTIHHRPSRLTIDQTKAREDINLFSVIRLNEKFAQEGHQILTHKTGHHKADGQSQNELHRRHS